METRLHYIYDPLCGWCYAVAPLIEAARAVISIELHGGGMMTGARRQRISPAWKDHVAPNDRQITRVTGQVFGEGYLHGLLEDHSAWLDSEPPTAAVLTAQQLKGAGLDMLARLYEAHYVEGRRIADEAVLTDLATQIRLDAGDFSECYRSFRGEKVNAHFVKSRNFLADVGGGGFPILVIERNDGFERLDHTQFLGRPDLWRGALQNMNTRQFASPEVAIGCGPGGCQI